MIIIFQEEEVANICALAAYKFDPDTPLCGEEMPIKLRTALAIVLLTKLGKSVDLENDDLDEMVTYLSEEDSYEDSVNRLCDYIKTFIEFTDQIDKIEFNPEGNKLFVFVH